MAKQVYSISPIAFLRYSSAEYSDQLLDGKLYFNTYRNLAGMEDDIGRGDFFELVHQQVTSDKITIPLSTHNITCIATKLPNGKYILNYRNDNFLANMFCLYSITAEQGFTELRHKLNEDMKGLGKSLIMIYNTAEFIRRIENKLKELKLDYIVSPIKYIDVSKPEWTKSYLEKPLKFAYQNELRIAFKSEEDKPQIIDIGNIRDIAELLPPSLKTIKIHSKQTALQREIESWKNAYFIEWSKKTIEYQMLLDDNSTDFERISEAKKAVEDARGDLLSCLEGIKYKD